MAKTPTRAQNPPYWALAASPLPKLITDPTPSHPPERVGVSRPLSSRGKCLFLLPESHRIEDLWHLGSLRPAGVCLRAPPALWGCKKPSFFPPPLRFFPYLPLPESFTTIKPLLSNERVLCFAVPESLLASSREGEPQKLITAPPSHKKKSLFGIKTIFIIRFEALHLSPGLARSLPGEVQLRKRNARHPVGNGNS